MNCSACGQSTGDNHRFCGYCGESVAHHESRRAAESVFHDSAPQVQRARLRLIRGGGGDGFVYALTEQEHPVGRTVGPIDFPDDPTVSPHHATFYYKGGRLFVRDETSLNGTFIRIHQPVPVVAGEVFLCGEQVLRFEPYRPLPVSIGEDAALFCGTPIDPWRFRVSQLLGGAKMGMALCTQDSVLTMGREACDMNFPHDRFISRHHARIDKQGDEFILRDLDSRNGTYFRLKQPVPLSNGDHLFIGRQLLRVEFI